MLQPYAPVSLRYLIGKASAAQPRGARWAQGGLVESEGRAYHLRPCR